MTVSAQLALHLRACRQVVHPRNRKRVLLEDGPTWSGRRHPGRALGARTRDMHSAHTLGSRTRARTRGTTWRPSLGAHTKAQTCTTLVCPGTRQRASPQRRVLAGCSFWSTSERCQTLAADERSCCACPQCAPRASASSARTECIPPACPKCVRRECAPSAYLVCALGVHARRACLECVPGVRALSC